MILFNPNNNPIEFFYGGIRIEFRPKESKNLPDNVAEHALKRAKVPLVEHTPMYDKEVKISDYLYSDMPWKKLVQMASARGIFKPGMSRDHLEILMEEYDNGERGTV
jgi:hypothetical protein